MKRNRRTRAVLLATLMIICLLSAVFLGGCGTGTKEARENFAVVLAAKATPDGISEAVGYLDTALSQRIDEDTASHMVAAYVEYLYRFINTDVDKTELAELTPYYDSDKKAIDEEKIKLSEGLSFYEKLKAGHLTFASETVPNPDPALPATLNLTLEIHYQSIIDTYGDKITPGLRELYELDEKIRTAPVLENATMMVSWQEVLDRAYTVETLLTEYPEDHLLWDHGDWLYKQYLTILLMGSTNSPAFDYETKKFSTEATNVYKDFVLANPDTILSGMLKEYFSYLGGIQFMLDYTDTAALESFFITCDNLAARAEAKLKEATSQTSVQEVHEAQNQTETLEILNTTILEK